MSWPNRFDHAARNPRRVGSIADLDKVYDEDRRSDAVRNHKEGILVCCAGPGTGKTWAFLQRVGSISTDTKSTPDEVCYLTFIREISRAFAADYEEEQQLVSELPYAPRMSTLHSFACRLIRNHGHRVGLQGPLYFASIADQHNPVSEIFMEDLLPLVKATGVDSVAKLRRVLRRIKEAWRDGKDPATLARPVPEILARAEELSRAYRLVDWDETVPLANDLFQNHDLRPAWITKIRHFLVDEYQDFNQSEQLFIASLAAGAKSTVIVGDEHQSIYRGRGGSPEGLRLLRESTGTDSVSFARCFRCKSNILQSVNTFLKVIDPAAQIMLPENLGGAIGCWGLKSAKAELEYLAALLRDRLKALPEKPQPKDGVVCLFPTRQALDFYIGRLMDLGVPCSSRIKKVHDTRVLLERALRLLFNPNQRFAERLILEEFAAVKRKQKSQMVDLVRTEDICPADAMERLLSSGDLQVSSRQSALAFCDLCSALSKRDFNRMPEVLSAYTQIDEQLIRESAVIILEALDDVEQDQAIEGLCDLLVPDSATPGEDVKSVLFLTMHGSKGLSRKTVVMPGLEEAMLPGSATGEDLAEKRRLFYVALSRATDEVVITFPRTRARGDPFNYRVTGRGRRSPFMALAGIPCRQLY